ncbi:hypothetical protein [Formosa sp. S-31]|uniref:hypothetical protein n=1 Tax=Formosa sp. S-31 TaxID=2790949 RepID=UPI003EB95964
MEYTDADIIEFQKQLVDLFMSSDRFPEGLKDDMVDYVNFKKALITESDKGCALLAVSHIAFLLEKVLKLKFAGTLKVKQQLLDFNGLLGSFSNRVLICHALGLISEQRLHELELIHKIGNAFGHSVVIASFDDEKITELCNNLHYTFKSNSSAKSKFLTSVSFVSGGLTALPYRSCPFTALPEKDISKAQNMSELFKETISSILELEKKTKMT